MPKTKEIERDYYTVAQAAEILAVSTTTVWRWIKAELLPAYRAGPKNIRIKKQDLATVVKSTTKGKEANMVRSKEHIPLFQMSPAEAQDQAAVVAHARALQDQILDRRSGKLLPPSWQDLNEAREERSAQL